MFFKYYESVKKTHYSFLEDHGLRLISLIRVCFAKVVDSVGSSTVQG